MGNKTKHMPGGGQNAVQDRELTLDNKLQLYKYLRGTCRLVIQSQRRTATSLCGPFSVTIMQF